MRIEIDEKFKREILPGLNAELLRSRDAAKDFMSATIWGSSKINYDYYFGRLPLAQLDGTSLNTDRTVESAVNSALTDLTTVFTTGEPVKFAAENSNPKEILGAQLATDAVNQIILRENVGHLILENAIKESLICGTSFVKHYWNVTTETITNKINAATSDEEISAYLQGLKASGIDFDDKKHVTISEVDEADGTRDITVTYKATKKSVKLDFVPIEQIMLEECCVTLDDCNYFAHRVYVTKQQLLDLGYPKEEIDHLLASFTEDTELYLLRSGRSEEGNYLSTMRDSQIDSENFAGRILVNEHYFRTSRIANDGTVHLYQIFEVNDHIFSIEEVDSIPFTDITCLPVGGTIWGESLANLVKDIQNMRSQIKRYMLDSAASQAYPSYIANREVDPRELVSAVTTPGTVVRVDDIGSAVTFFPQKNLPQGLDMLLANSENEVATRTGVNPTQQGINSDMVHAAGEATANLLLSNSQGRMRMMARTLANTFIKRLMRNVYDIYRSNAEVPLSVETAYGIVKVSPSDLPTRNHILVATALSNAEKAEEADRIIKLLAGLDAIDQNQTYAKDPQRKYFVKCEYIKSLGYKNVRDWVTAPEEMQPEQPDPMMMVQVQLAQAQAELANAQAGKMVNDTHESLDKYTNELQLSAERLKLDNARLMFDQEKAATEQALAAQQLELQRYEIELKNSHNADVTAIKRYQAETENLAESAKTLIDNKKVSEKE